MYTHDFCLKKAGYLVGELRHVLKKQVKTTYHEKKLKIKKLKKNKTTYHEL